MSTRAIPLEQFQIPTPCTEAWDAMRGDDAKRFCDKCDKHVHDLRHFDRAEADALLAAPVAGHVCVRMARDEAGRVITRDYWKFVAGAALAAGVGLSGCERRTQGESRPLPIPATEPIPAGGACPAEPPPPLPVRPVVPGICVPPSAPLAPQSEPVR
jgi:hypothetical protein